MGKGGGTAMYCPHCKEVRRCTANSSAQENTKGQTFVYKQFIDLQWFERGRTCQECEKNFTTVEIEKALLDELIFYRELIPETFKLLKEQLAGSNKSFSHLVEAINKLSTPAHRIQKIPEYRDELKEKLEELKHLRKGEKYRNEPK